MGTARYASGVRGSIASVVLTAQQEGLKAEVDPASTAVNCWLPAPHRSQTPSRRGTAA
jgi:hypothetical protein